MSQFHLKRGSPEEEFPDLGQNSTWMGQILTPAMYRRQFNRCTQSGVIFDDVIRLGLEEPGDVRLLSEDYTTIKIQLIRGSHRHSGNRNLTMNIRFWFIWKECQCWSVTAQSVTSVYEGHWLGPVSVGCVAGDAQSYILFCDFFDQVIEAYHKHKVTSQTPESDFNFDNLKGGDDLDRSYAVHCEVSAVRGVEDFCFPTHCSRGERRQLLTLARRALQWLEEEMPGRLLLLEELSQEQQRELNLDSPSPTQLRIGVARDWPDARAVWVSKNGSLVIWVNMDDHLKLVSTRNDANIAEAFKCICINLQKVSDESQATSPRQVFTCVEKCLHDVFKTVSGYTALLKRCSMAARQTLKETMANTRAFLVPLFGVEAALMFD
uniref:creatine kinase M-type isoform X2 n=1 Tax=Monopterus albus TaxID=43700 RepID=UPI0009B48F7F|nr:creatine kinase M-type-like isoform X2 [Monopterus albus]